MHCRSYDWIGYNARLTPEKLATVDVASGRRFTYRVFYERIVALASFLSRDLEVRHDDRVCVLAKSCVEAFEIQFACALLGAIFLPVNWRLTVTELDYILHDAEPSVLLFEHEFKETAADLASRLNEFGHVAFGGGEASSRYEAGIEAHRGALFQAPPVDLESTWAILYTSGTTGHPKGAMQSYRMMLANVLNFGPARLTAETVFLCAMPTFHTGGLNCYANPVFHAGGTVIVMREFDPARALDLMASGMPPITHFFGTPAHYLFISQQPGFSAARFPSLSIAGLGGAPATDALVRTWLDKGVPLQPAYGMTEIGPAILVSDLDRAPRKVGSSGIPVRHCDLKIVALDGSDAPAGEVGEICVKGPVLMSGYWRKPEATRAAFRGGWFATGDAAYCDEDGFVFIVDRLKDMFISGGENVYPVEVENALCAAPGVAAAAVVGIPDETWGEVGRAFVVVLQGCSPSQEGILEHCRSRLARFKVPKSIVFLAALPRTASGKVLKRDLREWTGNDG